MQRLPAMLCLIGALAGCEEAGVTNVSRRAMIGPEKLMEIERESGAILVEIHGAPWEGARDDEIAGTLRMPEGPARGVRFRAVPAGQGRIGGGRRLVLHFNPEGEPDAAAACAAREELPVKRLRRGGFTLHATFCEGTEWLVQAHLNADEASANDWLAYYLETKDLLGKMFPEW